MSTYANAVTPVVDTVVSVIESAEHAAVKAVGTVRKSVSDLLPDMLPDIEAPAALSSRLDLADVINVTFDAAERLLEAQRDAYLGLVKAVKPASRPLAKAA